MKNYGTHIYYEIITRKGTVLNTFTDQYKATKYFNEFPIASGVEIYLIKHVEELIAERGDHNEGDNKDERN